jgi:hypothetical protein
MVNWGDNIGFDFCEGKYYPNTLGLPQKELGNTLSSLSMVFVGFFGIWFNKTPNQLIKGIFGLLIVNGVGSIGFHWTREYGWNMVDTVPMVILIGWGSSLAMNEIILNLRVKTKWNGYFGNILTGFFMFYIVITISIIGIEGNAERVFQILFGLPYLVIYGFLGYFSVNANQLYVDNEEIFALIPRTGISGIVGFIFWLVDNFGCNPITGFINFHVFWHILISYSTYILIVFISCLMAENYYYIPHLDWYFGNLIPTFTWNNPSS